MSKMLCEPTCGGWRCSKFKDGKWVPENDVFVTVDLDNRNVVLPPLAGKVLFEDTNCKVEVEKGLKVLVCKN